MIKYELRCPNETCSQFGGWIEVKCDPDDIQNQLCEHCGYPLQQDFTNKGVAIDTSKIRGWNNE